ncbi:MAG: hypothetical protein, partial [Olavius algarvensis Gamma 1 endosymbiont]
SGADVDTSNSITSLARNNDSILDPIQSSGIRQLHKDELIENWNFCRNGKTPNPMEPLE